MKTLIIQTLSIVTFLFFLFDSTLAQETIHITTDRSIYITGEPIWIYAHNSVSASNKRSNISKIGYVELLNKENTPVLQSKINLNPGNNSVRLFIPDSIRTGNYTLRAYTQWMLNYHYDLFKYQRISIINPFSTNKFPKSETQFRKDTIITFTEGNKPLLNIKNKVVLQILDTYGKGRQTKAYITNSGNDTLLNFKTNEAGFAKITYTPKTNDEYSIKYNVANNVFSHKLTQATSKGCQLAFTESKDDLQFKVLSNDRINSCFLHLSSLNGDFIKKYTISKKPLNIAKKTLPSGYICAQIVAPRGKLLASRYFMAHIPEHKISTIALNKDAYTNRDKVLLSLDGFEHLKNKSISVTKSCMQDQTDFLNNKKLLSSYAYNTLQKWVKGNLSTNDILQCFSAPDYIINDSSQICFLPEYNGDIISGVMSDKTTHTPIKNEKIMLNFVGPKAFMHITNTDSLGKFSFITNQFGKQELVIQPLNEDSELLDYKIDLNYSYCNLFTQNSLPEFRLLKEDAILINKAIINMQINTIYNINKYHIKKDFESDSASFYGDPNYMVPLSKYIDLASTEEIINELLPFSSISKQKGVHSLRIYEESSLNRSTGASFTMVDGVYINDFDRILEIPGEDLKKIDLINVNYIFEGNELGRIVAFYTKKGVLEMPNFDDKIFRQTQDCFCQPYLLKGPDYSKSSSENNTTPDFRNLLYWKTDIKNKEYSFYTTDENSKYTIVVKGINEFGQTEEYTKEFEVDSKR